MLTNPENQTPRFGPRHTAALAILIAGLLWTPAALAGPLDEALPCSERPVGLGCASWTFSTPDGFQLGAAAVHPLDHTHYQSGREGSQTRVTGLDTDAGDFRFNVKLPFEYQEQALAATTDGSYLLLAGSTPAGATELTRLEPLFGLLRGSFALPAVGTVADDGIFVTDAAAFVLVEDVRTDAAGDLAVVRFDLASTTVTETVVGTPGLTDAPHAATLDASGATLVLAYLTPDVSQTTVHLVGIDTTTLATVWSTSIALAADVHHGIDLATAGTQTLLLAPDAVRAYATADGTPTWSRTHSGAGLGDGFAPAAIAGDADTGRVVVVGDAPTATGRDVSAAGLNLSDGAFAWAQSYAGPGLDGEDTAVEVVLTADGATALLVAQSRGHHATVDDLGAGHGQDVTVFALSAATGSENWSLTDFDSSLPNDQTRIADAEDLDETVRTVRLADGADRLIVGTDTYKDSYTVAFGL